MDHRPQSRIQKYKTLRLHRKNLDGHGYGDDFLSTTSKITIHKKKKRVISTSLKSSKTLTDISPKKIYKWQISVNAN